MNDMQTAPTVVTISSATAEATGTEPGIIQTPAGKPNVRVKVVPTWVIILNRSWKMYLQTLIGLLTVAGLNVGALIGGAVVVERIFKVPGIGGELAESIFRQQILETQSLVVLIAIFYVVLNFFVDLLYTVLDPRIRHARAIA